MRKPRSPFAWAENMEDFGEMWSKAFRYGIVLALGSAFCLSGLQAQDEAYRIQYDVYQHAIAIEDPDERAQALIDFLKNFPDSTLIEYIDSAYRTMLQEQFQAGNYDKTLALSEKWFEVRPDDPAALYFTAYIHFQKGNHAKAIELAEKLYDTAEPQVKKTLSYILAISAVQTADIQRILKYGDEACAQFPAKDCYPVYVELMKHYSSKQEYDKAANYADKALEGLEAADPQDATTKEYVQKNIVLCYAVKGNNDFERERWSKSITNYQKVLRLTKNKDLVGECYYKIGMSYWRMGKVDPEAMQSFARGHKRGTGQHAKQCYKYLEELYRRGHNDSTAGMDEFIERAISSE